MNTSHTRVGVGVGAEASGCESVARRGSSSGFSPIDSVLTSRRQITRLSLQRGQPLKLRANETVLDGYLVGGQAMIGEPDQVQVQIAELNRLCVHAEDERSLQAHRGMFVQDDSQIGDLCNFEAQVELGELNVDH